MRIIHAISILTAVALCGSSAEAQMTIEKPPHSTTAPSKFRSAEDGWLDVSGFLDEKYGFLPVVIPITEPAVGYGAAAGRWQFWRRFSLVGFAGGGAAWTELGRFQNTKAVVTGRDPERRSLSFPAQARP